MEWISVNDKLPDFEETVLTWNGNEPHEPSRTDQLLKISEDRSGHHVEWRTGLPTHWMPLPEPPKN